MCTERQARGVARGVPNAHRTMPKLRRVACVDGQRDSSDIAAAIPQQEFDAARNVDWIRHALQRAAPSNLFALRLAKLMGHLGGDESGGEGIHGDAELAHLARQRSRESD